MHICFIIPPHILKEIARNGTDLQKQSAEHTIMLSDQIRRERQMLPTLPSAATNQKHRLIYDTYGTQNLPGTLVRSEGQSVIDDTESNEAYDGTGATYDLYLQAYQRNSIDNKGMDLISSVHYSQKYDNAFWNGSQMVYGDGDGELFQRFTKPIDVTGHELTHGVTQYTANLDYQDQPGALNESFSDVFGSLVKQKTLNQTASQADWLIGEGIFTTKVKGIALRSMKAPGTAYDDPVLGKDPQPATMDAYHQMDDDNGGVHINSGIPNHAFYLAATIIGGYAWEKTGKIWYEALTTVLQHDTQFADCARATIDMAKKLFGSTEEDAVTKAWQEVGVI